MDIERLRKMAEKMETNENERPKFEEPRVGPDMPPPQEPPPADPFHNSESVWKASLDSKFGELDRLFDKYDEAASASLDRVAKNFDVKTFISHSPLLQKRNKQEAGEPETLRTILKMKGL